MTTNGRSPHRCPVLIGAGTGSGKGSDVRGSVRLDVLPRVLELDRDPLRVLRLEGNELDRDLVSRGEVDVVPEVEQVLALLLGHVVVVRLARRPDRGPPVLAAGLAGTDVADR